MKGLVLLLGFALVACTADEHEMAVTTSSMPTDMAVVETVPVEDTSATSSAAGAMNGAFVVRKNGNDVYRETFQRGSERVSSTITVPETGQRVEQVVELRPDGTVESVAVQVFDRASQVTERWSVSMQNGSALVEGAEGKAPQQRVTMNVPANTIPVPVNDSIVMAEQIVRHATKMGGNGDAIDVLSFSDGKPSVDKVRVSFTGANRARIEGTGTSMEVVTDGQGHIVSGQDQTQGVTVERIAQGS